ncbi:MAG: hypothetical protein ABI837_01445 [Acidobacteriota bacterium]
MRKTTFLTMILGLLLLTPMARAQSSVYSDTYVLPVAAHVTGINGTWATDVTITNFNATDLTVQLVLVESGEGNSDNIFPVTTSTIVDGSVRVPAGTTVLFKDILNGYKGGSSASGALILGGDEPFAVTSKIYLQTATGTSLGQVITPVRDFFENSTGRSDNTQVAVIPGIINNATTRTNIGIVAGAGSAGGATFAVEVTIKDSRGTVLGKKLITIPPGNFTQTQFNVASALNNPATNFDLGSAEFRLVQGTGAVVPYASIVENSTGNGMYVAAQFPANVAFAKTGFSSNIFRSLFH